MAEALLETGLRRLHGCSEPGGIVRIASYGDMGALGVALIGVAGLGIERGDGRQQGFAIHQLPSL